LWNSEVLVNCESQSVSHYRSACKIRIWSSHVVVCPNEASDVTDHMVMAKRIKLRYSASREMFRFAYLGESRV